MSLMSLRLGAEALRAEDGTLEQYERSQTKKRAVKLEEADIEAQAAELLGKVEASIFKHTNRVVIGQSNIPLKTHPECVVQRVIEKLAAKGVKAKHVVNEYHPKIDRLDIDLSSVQFKF